MLCVREILIITGLRVLLGLKVSKVTLEVEKPL